MRVTRSRELVAEGHSPTVVARVAMISRQAIYRTPTTMPAPARRARPPADDVEAAIIEIAEQNPTDGYRIVREWVVRKLGRQVNRKKVCASCASASSSSATIESPGAGGPGSSRCSGPVSSGTWT